MIFGWGFLPRLGIKGATLATGLGQTVAAILYIIIYLVKPIPVKIRRKELKPEADMAKRLYSIGLPASLSLALPSILISVLNVILSAYSAVYVFVLGVYYKLQTFLYLPANGVVQGMRPLMGYNYGAVIIPVALVESRFMGAVGVWHAFWITEAVTGIVSLIVYKKNA